MMKKQRDRTPIAPRHPAQRSRLTNGFGQLPGTDGRSERARRYRDIVADLTVDVVRREGRPLKAAETSLVSQVAVLTIQREAMAASIVLGEKIDARHLVLVAGSISRTLAQLGIADRTGRSVLVVRVPTQDPLEPQHPPSEAELDRRHELYLKFVEMCKRHPSNLDLQTRLKRINEIFERVRKRLKRSERRKKKALEPLTV